jgi:hypothetical protein
MSALIASSLGHIFLGFAVLAFRLCAQAPKEMIAITDRLSHTLGPGLLILRTLIRWFPRTPVTSLTFSVNHLHSSIQTLAATAAFRQLCS